MDEIWRDVEGYIGFYQVSNLGRVKALKCKRLVCGVNRHSSGLCNETWVRNERILKPIVAGSNPQATTRVHLYKLVGSKHVRKDYAIKYLVAQAFLPEFTKSTSCSQIRKIDPASDYRASNLCIVAKSNARSKSL